MRFFIIGICGIILFCNSSLIKIKSENNLSKRTGNYYFFQKLQSNKYDSFKLYYSSAGLGSGMGNMAPRFVVEGTNYIYTYQQNSYYSKPNKQPDTICIGQLRIASIDSIIDLIKDVKDTLIYNTNIGVMSGSIEYISIIYNTINLKFQLHNASNPIAEKIVTILNSNIPADKNRLWLFTWD